MLHSDCIFSSAPSGSNVHSRSVEWSLTALWSCYDFQVQQRAVANVHFIGNLHRKKVVSEKLMHGCVCELLAGFESPKQQDVECLVRLMDTAGQQMEANPLAKGHMDAYFERITMLSTNMSLERRIRFMLQASMQPFWSTVHINMPCLMLREETLL